LFQPENPKILHEHPKMCLLVFNSLVDYIKVFENEFISIYEILDKIVQEEKSLAPESKKLK
jgi:hypothetical protein